jgi:hypothetical protein
MRSKYLSEAAAAWKSRRLGIRPTPSAALEVIESVRACAGHGPRISLLSIDIVVLHVACQTEIGSDDDKRCGKPDFALDWFIKADA